MAQHPPLYYLLVRLGAEVFDVATPGNFAYDVEFWLIRVANIAFLLPIPLLGYLTARRISPKRPVWIVSAILPLSIPGFMIRNGPMINNDNAITLGGALLVLVVARILSGDVTWRTAGFSGLVCGLSMITKAFGIIFLLSLGITYSIAAIQALPNRGPFKNAIWTGAFAFLISMVSGGWWYIKNIISMGEFRESGVTRPLAENVEPDWLHWFLAILRQSWESFWGGSYVLVPGDHRILLNILVLMTGILILVAMVGGKQMAKDTSKILLPLIVLIAVVYANQGRGYYLRDRIAIHGRYLYGGLTAVTTAMAAGSGIMFDRILHRLPIVVLGGSLAIYVVGIHSFLVRAWGDQGNDIFERVLAVLAWSPLAGWIVISLVVGFVLLSCILGLRLRLAFPREFERSNG